jgi:hypothetical protein
MAIRQIDFHLDKHSIQVRKGKLRVFIDGDRKRKPVELDAMEVMRILRVASEQLEESDDHDYVDAI